MTEMIKLGHKIQGACTVAFTENQNETIRRDLIREGAALRCDHRDAENLR